MPTSDSPLEQQIEANYFKIRQKLPRGFQDFSHEFLCQMIFNRDHGYPPRVGAWLTEEAEKEYKASPRQYLINMLKKERDGAAECLRLLGVAD